MICLHTLALPLEYDSTDILEIEPADLARSFILTVAFAALVQIVKLVCLAGIPQFGLIPLKPSSTTVCALRHEIAWRERLGIRIYHTRKR